MISRLLQSATLPLCLAGCLAAPLSAFAQHGAAGVKSGRAQAQEALSPRDSRLFAEAVAQYDAGHPAVASPVLTSLAARYPHTERIQAATGMSLLESSRTAEAIPFLERALKLKSNESIERNLALAYVDAGRPLDALPMLQRVTASAPADFEAWFALGQALAISKQPGAAAAAYQHAASVATPDATHTLPNLLYDWAVALLADNQPKAALAVLDRLPASSMDAQSASLRAEAEEKSVAYEAALADYRRAAELDGSAANIQAYGEELMRHSSFGPASSIFEYGVQKHPESDALRRDLGIASFGANNFKKAGDVFGSLLNEHPDDAALADLLGRTCDALASERSEFCTRLPAFAKAHPANAAASLYAAIALLHQPASTQTYAEADAFLQAALKAQPQLAAAWYQQGVLQQLRNDWAGSANSLEQAVSLNAGSAEAHYRLSRAYAHLGRTAEAKEQLALQQSTAIQEKEIERQRLAKEVLFLPVTP